jgi:CRP-like cAMP-binding protein
MFPVPKPSRSANRILAAIDRADYSELFSKLETVSLAQGQVIYEADSPINYVYFPETAVFSMLSILEDGRTVEVGPVGQEGL